MRESKHLQRMARASNHPRNLGRGTTESAPVEEARRNLFSLAHRATERIASDVWAELESVGPGSMGRALITVLLHLDLEGNRASDLAARTGLTRSTASAHVRRLTTAGLVRTVPDPSDGRARLVLLTDRGLVAVRHVLNAVRTVSVRYADTIGQRRMTQLATGLRLVADSEP